MVVVVVALQYGSHSPDLDQHMQSIIVFNLRACTSCQDAECDTLLSQISSIRTAAAAACRRSGYNATLH